MQEESLAKKSDPDTCTVAPTEAEVGLSASEGGWVETTKLAIAVSPVGLPVAVMVYGPAALGETVNAPASNPSEIVQDWEATAPPVIEQLVSPVEKPDPLT